MKNKSIIELFSHQYSGVDSTALNSFAKNEGFDLDQPEQLKSAVDAYEEVISSIIEVFNGTASAQPLTNAMTIDDLSVLVEKAVQRVIVEATPAPKLLVDNFTEIHRFQDDAPGSMEFIEIAGIYAGWVSATGEYPSSSAGLNRSVMSIKFRKAGLTIDMQEELVNSALFPIVAYSVRAGRDAVERFQESTLWDTMRTRAKVVFDNTVSGRHTTGKNQTNAANATMSFYDWTKMYTALLNAKKTPTDIMGHPLGFGMFFYDPFVRYMALHGGGNMYGASDAWSRAPEYTQPAPFGLRVNWNSVIDYAENATLGAPFNTEPAALVVDAYMLDRNNSLYMAQKGEISTEGPFTDWKKDLMHLKMRTYFDTAVKDGGRGMVAARNIRIDRNDEPVYTVNQV